MICQAGIFHGGKPLCEVQKTRAAVVTCEGDAKWEQDLRFPIKVNNIPRMARLCFGIYEIETKNLKNKKKGKESTKVNYFLYLLCIRHGSYRDHYVE